MNPAAAIHDVPRLLDYGQLGVIALLVLLVVGPMVAIMWRFVNASIRAMDTCASSIRGLADGIKTDRHEANNRLAQALFEVHDHVTDVESRLSKQVGAIQYEARAGSCRYGQTPRGMPQIDVTEAPRYSPPGDPEPAG